MPRGTDKPFSFEKAEDSPGFLLWQATTLWQRGIRKALEPTDLTHSQFVLLASILWLSMHNKEITQVTLSEHSRIDVMTTSTVLRTLAAKGFITRGEHATDTRAKTVTLTEKGQKTVKGAIVAVESYDHKFFSALDLAVSEFNRHLMKLLKSN